MDLPCELRHSVVEVIVLPVENQSKNKQPTSPKRPQKIRNDIIDRLQANPLKIDDFVPLSRGQVYEG